MYKSDVMQISASFIYLTSSLQPFSANNGVADATLLPMIRTGAFHDAQVQTSCQRYIDDCLRRFLIWRLGLPQLTSVASIFTLKCFSTFFAALILAGGCCSSIMAPSVLL